MVEIKDLEHQHLSLLATCYGYAKFLYGNRLQKGSQWVLKRAKKHICKHFAHTIAQIPEAARGYFAPGVSERELFDFLAECYAENSRLAAARFELQKETLQPLGDAVVRMVQDLQNAWDEDGEAPGVLIEGEQIILLGEEGAALERKLILENGILAPEVAERGFLLNIQEVKRENDWYVFYEAEEYTQREAVRFTNAYVQARSIDCTRELAFHTSAWMVLFRLAYAIVQKSELPGGYCNEQETALLPLLKEIKQFGFLKEYPLLTQLAEQTGCRSAAFDKLLEKAIRKKYARFDSGLDRAEFEPMLRAIYEKIRQSQEEYPNKVALYCDAREVALKRRALTELFYSRGFAGEYPDFHKTADIPGYHMVSGNYGNALYCRVKNAQMFIHCAEGCAWNGELLVHFYCGRALTGKRPPVQDIFSCYFRDKGYRWNQWIWLHAKEETLEAANVAVKILQLEKLTKQEQKQYGEYNYGMIKESRIALIVAMLTFPATVLLISILMAIFGEWAELEKLITALLNWKILGFYATIFLLPLSVIALIARRR
ncbi:MAG: hypothetical protein IKY59_04330 [Oscillospiraceae bacterium]|nr:hypothetical protein [Oscillospiraceae bacterium]